MEYTTKSAGIPNYMTFNDRGSENIEVISNMFADVFQDLYVSPPKTYHP